ncbi:MAG: glucose-6-phosphate isomerase family protein [Actinomycetes bacterium]
MATYATPPVRPYRLTMDVTAGTIAPEGPTLVRRLSDLEGLFRDGPAWRSDVAAEDRVVYTVSSSPVPEADGEVAQSITTIVPGTCAGEFFMTKGHQHTDHQGEVYLGLSGVGGLLLFDGERTEWVDMAEGVIGYVPPGWAHRSVNTGDQPYKFLAVYPGCAGHDYGWVLDHGMGRRVLRTHDGLELADYEG